MGWIKELRNFMYINKKGCYRLSLELNNTKNIRLRMTGNMSGVPLG